MYKDFISHWRASVPKKTTLKSTPIFHYVTFFGGAAWCPVCNSCRTSREPVAAHVITIRAGPNGTISKYRDTTSVSVSNFQSIEVSTG